MSDLLAVLLADTLGAALLGAKVGDSVDYQAPRGTFTVEVVGIRPYS